MNMMQNEILKDSIQRITENTHNFTESTNGFILANAIIILPLLLLIIIYSLKYFFGNSFNKKAFLEFLLEFPVDFGFIGITFVFTYSFLDIETVMFGKIMILISILIAMITSSIRRFALKEYYKESSNYLVLGAYGVLNTTIAIMFVFFILSTINNG